MMLLAARAGSATPALCGGSSGGAPSSLLSSPLAPRRGSTRTVAAAPAAAAAAAAAADHRRGSTRSVAAAAAAAKAAAAAGSGVMPPLPAVRRAWFVEAPGDLVGGMRLVEEPLVQQLRPGECLVEVRCIGLNMADVFCSLGLYKAAPKERYVPGLEFAGVVLAVGPPPQPPSPSVPPPPPPPFAVGDRVLGVPRFGAFATHVALGGAYLRRVPDGWSFEQAAAFPVQTLTAAYGLFECGGFRPGQRVLVHSAAGGVGLQALQILARSGGGAAPDGRPTAVLGLVGGAPGKVRLLRRLYHGQQQGDGDDDSDQDQQQQQQQQPQQEQQDQQALLSEVQPLPPTRAAMEFAVRASAGRRGRAAEAAAREQLTAFLAAAAPPPAAAAAGTGAGPTAAAAAAADAAPSASAPPPPPGFDVVLDSLLGPDFAAAFDLLAPCGRHVVFGAGSLTPDPAARFTVRGALAAPLATLAAAARLVAGFLSRPRVDAVSLPGRNAGVVGFNLIWLHDRLDLLAGLYERVDALRLPPPLVGAAYDFERLPEALRHLQSGRSVGKVVVRVVAPPPPAPPPPAR